MPSGCNPKCPPSQVGHNELSELELAYGDLEHMNTLSAPNNSIVETPRGIGQLQMLVVLDLSHNKLEQVPASSSNLFNPFRLPSPLPM